MRLVANSAVLGHRLVVVDEGTTFFHVTGEAGLIGTILDELLRRVTVNIVAGGAGHLPFNNRMV